MIKMKVIVALVVLVAATEAVRLRFRPSSKADPGSSPAWCKGLDCPTFKVLESTADYELREYDASNWVSVTMVDIDKSTASRQMFMKLFNYIQGANMKKEKIDMTVPVRTRIIPAPGPACEDNFTMSFFLSQKIRDPPQPTDPDVFIDTLPQKYMVYVSQFGGYYMKIESWINKAIELSEALDKDGKTYETGFYFTNGYDSPWSFFNRHNEIWFEKK